MRNLFIVALFFFFGSAVAYSDEQEVLQDSVQRTTLVMAGGGLWAAAEQNRLNHLRIDARALASLTNSKEIADLYELELKRVSHVKKFTKADRKRLKELRAVWDQRVREATSLDQLRTAKRTPTFLALNRNVEKQLAAINRGTLGVGIVMAPAIIATIYNYKKVSDSDSLSVDPGVEIGSAVSK